MKSLKSLKSFFKRVCRKTLQKLSKKELIIILSFAVGVIIATAIIIVLKINSPDKPVAGSDDSSVDITIGNSDDNETPADDEEITIVETATADTKVESTADTTVLTLKEGTKNGYMNRCVFLGDSRTVAMVNYGLFNDDAALAQIGISHPSFKNNTFINNAGKQYTLKSY